MAAVLEQTRASASATPAHPAPARLLSLDAYRGFIMILLCSEGFGLRSLAQHRGFAWLADQFRHVPWEGVVLWDLIQPAFLFMVGVAMPLALARRTAEGAGFGEVFRHVLWRTFALIALSQVLIVIQSGRLQFQLINVLSQIAFTYLLTFLILQLRFRWQAVAAVAMLAGHWALFALFPGPAGAFSKEGNIGAVLDRAVLGYNYSGYYVTLNFLSSTVTTLLGAWTGRLALDARPHAWRMKILAAAAAAGLLGGLALEAFNPMVKRLWTASFTLFSAGWVFLMLLGFYWLIEVRGRRGWAFPLMVAGMNSIFLYCLYMVLRGWMDQSLAVFTGRFRLLGAAGPVAQATLLVVVMWSACWWLYRRKIFFKL